MNSLRILCGILFCVTAISCRQESGRASAGAEDPVNKSAEAKDRAPRVILIRDGDIYIAELPDGEPKLLVEHKEPVEWTWLRPINGEALVYWHYGENGDDWWFLDLNSGKRKPLFVTEYTNMSVGWEPSPDGRWIASFLSDCMLGAASPLSLRNINGEKVKDFYRKKGGSSGNGEDYFLQHVNFLWSADGSRLNVLMHYPGDSPRKTPPSLREYKTPEMRARDLSKRLPKGREIGRSWVDDDGYIVLVTKGFKPTLYAFHPDKWKSYELHLPFTGSAEPYRSATGLNAPGPNAHDRYFLAEKKLVYVQWDKSVIRQYEVPAIAISETGNDEFRLREFSAPRINGKDYLLLERERLNPETSLPEFEIHLAPVGETETKLIYSGYQFGALVE